MPVLPSQRLRFDGLDVDVKVEFAEGGKPEYQEKNPRIRLRSTNVGQREEPRLDPGS